MAMTIEEAFNGLLIQKETFSTLTGLTQVSDFQDFLQELSSDSKVANWLMELYNQAVVISVIENKFESESINIQNTLAGAQVTNAQWYRENVLLYQFEDLVQMVDNKPSYVIVDVDKQIIEFCSIEEIQNGVNIKVKRKDGTTLSIDEVNGLSSYLARIKGISANIFIINLEPDDVKFYYNIYYDPQINVEVLKVNVEEVLSTYLTTLPFDSVVYANLVTDLLQEIPGILDPQFIKIEAKENQDPVYVEFGYTYDLIAGYGILQSVENTINYYVG